MTRQVHRWLVSALTVCCAAAQDKAEFPLEIGRVRLKVMINGQGPFPFGFDTGASGVGWVTQALVAKLQLPPAEGFRVSDGMTSKGAAGARIDSLVLGPVSVKRAVTPVLDGGPCESDGDGVCGTLGLDAFQGHTLALDYPGKRLIVSKEPLPLPNGMEVLAYVADHGAPRVEILLAGVSISAWLDSGNRGTMLLPLAFAKQLPLAGELSPAGKVASVVKQYDLHKAQLAGSVRLGAVSIEKPELFFTDMVKEPNVGRGILQSLVVTFDTLNQRVRFSRPAPR